MARRGSFYVESLGCAKNQVDSELMIQHLKAAGWQWTDTPGGADVLIVNTCGFITTAKTESIQTGLSFRERFPGKRIYMVGCLSERYGDELADELPELDGFMGNQDPAAIVRLIDGRGSPRGRTAPRLRKSAPAAGAQPDRERLLSYPGSAYVKVAEGCGNRCTYCAIPLIRGALLSRPREEVRAEIEGLLGRGIREIVLIAQDLGSYGADRGQPELAQLLAEISRIPGDFWVRLLYIHPDHFPREIVPLLQGDPRLLPYFDLPFQHASPLILSAMGRIGDPEKNLSLIRDLREALPGAVIRSTFLVGFPGETPEDFGRLLEFQAAAALDWLGVFTYSREEDTAAYRLGNRVPRKTAEERKTIIEERQVPLTEAALDRQVGRELDALVEEPVSGEGLAICRLYLQAPEVDGLTVVRTQAPAGSVLRARITRRNGLDLEGEEIPQGPDG